MLAQLFLFLVCRVQRRLMTADFPEPPFEDDSPTDENLLGRNIAKLQKTQFKKPQIKKMHANRREGAEDINARG